MKKSELEMLIKLRDKYGNHVKDCMDMFKKIDDEIEELDNLYEMGTDDDVLYTIQESINELNRDRDKYTGQYHSLSRVEIDLSFLIELIKKNRKGDK